MNREYIHPPYPWQSQLHDLMDIEPDVAILADMGTGKTKGLIDGLRFKYQAYRQLKKTIIFSPLVTLYNWQNEWLRHSNIPREKIHVLSGSSDKKLKKLLNAVEHNPNQIIILNYESVNSDKIMKALHDWAPEIMVLDESHYCKNYQSQRSKKIHALSLKCIHRYIMTGTPMTNSATDIFQQFKILDNGKTFGTNYFTFQRTYMYDENSSWSHLHTHFPKWRPRPEMLDALKEKIYSKGIRVTKDEVLKLPNRRSEIYEVDLSPAQRKYYEQMEQDYLTFVQENALKGISVATTAMTKALRMQQIVTGYVKLDDGQEIEIKENPRLTALEELIEALHENHKVIIWSAFTFNYKQIARLLEKMKIKHIFITGDEKLEEKQANMEAFNNDPEVRIAVCNRKAAGIGVNLVAAAYSITYSRNYSLEQELQANDRNYRGGSEIHDEIVKIDLCAKDTVDQIVTANLVEKKNVADKVIDIVKQRRAQ